MMIFVLILIIVVVFIILNHKSVENYSYKSCRIIPVNLLKFQKPRVVISLTTMPNRVSFLPMIVEDIKKQTLLPDHIYLNIPMYSKRLKTEYKIPQDWNFTDDVSIIRCKDYGPATKLLGCIPYESDGDTIIITIDDDQEYNKNLIMQRVCYCMSYPNACVAGGSKPKKFGNLITSPDIKYLEGYSGIAYRRKCIFSEMMFDYFDNNMCDDCFLSDDLTIAALLRMNGVFLISTNTAGIDRKTFRHIDKYTPLHKQERKKVYENCKKALEYYEYSREFIWSKGFNFIADKYENLTHNAKSKFNEKNYQNIKEGDIIRIRTWHLKDFIDKVFKKLNVSIILLTGDCVKTIPDDIWSVKRLKPSMSFPDFLNDARLKYWLAQNLDGKYRCAKLDHLPVGFDYHLEYFKNNQHPNFQEKKIKEMIKNFDDISLRPLKIYANFHFVNSSKRFKHIFGEDRYDIYQKLKNNKLIDFEKNKTSRLDYFQKCNNYSFVISPIGNGLDCHRTWEALILGCIVIVKTSPLDAMYDELPVVIVNDWDEINIDNLKSWKLWRIKSKFNMEKLKAAYWKNKCKNARNF